MQLNYSSTKMRYTNFIYSLLCGLCSYYFVLLPMDIHKEENINKHYKDIDATYIFYVFVQSYNSQRSGQVQALRNGGAHWCRFLDVPLIAGHCEIWALIVFIQYFDVQTSKGGKRVAIVLLSLKVKEKNSCDVLLSDTFRVIGMGSYPRVLAVRQTALTCVRKHEKQKQRACIV